MADKQKQSTPKQSAPTGGVFKTVAMGFDKKEVNLYIKKIIDDKDKEAEERIAKEISALKDAVDSNDSNELLEKISNLNSDLEKERDKAKKLETRCNNMQTNLDRVTDELEKAKKQAGASAVSNAKAAKAEADTIIKDAKKQAAEIIANAKSKSKPAPAPSGGGVNPKVFKDVLAQLEGGKKKLEASYFDLSAFFSESAEIIEKSMKSALSADSGKVAASTAPATSKKTNKDLTVAPPSDEFNEFSDFSIDSGSQDVSDDLSEFADLAVDGGGSKGVSDDLSEFADLAVGSGSQGVSDDLSEFADLAVGSGGSQGVSDDLSEFADFAVGGGSQGVSDDLSEFADFAIDSGSQGAGDDLSEFADFSIDEPLPPLEPKPVPIKKKRKPKAAEGEAGPPLLQKANKGEFSEDFQDFMLAPSETEIRGDNLTAGEVEVKTMDRGDDLDENLFEMMLSHNVGELQATENEDGGYTIFGSETDLTDSNDDFEDFMSMSADGGSDDVVIKSPQDPLDSMWNFDMDEDANGDSDDMTSDNDGISDLLL